MKLYYSPGACSMAPHIVLQEAGMKHAAEAVNLKTHQVGGSDYYKINPKGSVPALELDNGQLLTENAVVIQYICDQTQEAGLLPKAGTLERYRAMEWLNFIATELHKGFGPLWNPNTLPEARQQAVENLGKKFDFLAKHFKTNSFLMGQQFSAPDAYLFTVLNWTNFHKIDMGKWPELKSYMERVGSRPAVQSTLKAEGLM